MGMSAGGGGGGPVAGINVTPLIDVLLVLLIIFMVIVPNNPKGLEALVPQPPKPNTPDVPNQRTIVVQAYPGGPGGVTYKINDQAFSKDQLTPQLQQIFATRQEKVMFVKGDPKLDFGVIAQIIGYGHAAEVTNIGMITPQVEAGH